MTTSPTLSELLAENERLRAELLRWQEHTATFIGCGAALELELAAMTAARDEACDLLESALAENPYAISEKSIAALRAVGAAK